MWHMGKVVSQISGEKMEQSEMMLGQLDSHMGKNMWGLYLMP